MKNPLEIKEAALVKARMEISPIRQSLQTAQSITRNVLKELEKETFIIDQRYATILLGKIADADRTLDQLEESLVDTRTGVQRALRQIAMFKVP